MENAILAQLFWAVAHHTVQETGELLRTGAAFPAAGEDFFRRIHDLKAQALAANLKTLADQLHEMEGVLWGK